MAISTLARLVRSVISSVARSGVDAADDKMSSRSCVSPIVSWYQPLAS